MKRNTFFISLILILSGCKHYYYAPSTQNVPLFKEKNEIRASISSGGGDEITTNDFQAAYAVTDKIGVIANYMTAKGGGEYSGNRGNGRYFEAGGGYFKALGKYGVFEVFGGAGVGRQKHYYEDTTYGWSSSSTTFSGTAELSFSKFFLQPSIGFSLNGLDIAFTPAFSRISFNRIVNSIDTADLNYFPVNNLALHRNSFLFEPGYTIRGGWKYLKLQLQIISIENLSHKNLDFERTKISLGLTFAFAERFRKSESKKPKVDLE